MSDTIEVHIEHNGETHLAGYSATRGAAAGVQSLNTRTNG